MIVQTPNEKIHVRSYFGYSKREAIHKVRVTDLTRRRGWFSISLPLQQRNEVGAVSDNWVVQAMQSAFEIWNDKLTEIWSLITTTPQEFRDGDIWNAIVGINEG